MTSKQRREKLRADYKESMGMPKFQRISEETEVSQMMREEGYTYSEIAEYLNVSVSTVVKRLRDAREKAQLGDDSSRRRAYYEKHRGEISKRAEARGERIGQWEEVDHDAPETDDNGNEKSEVKKDDEST